MPHVDMQKIEAEMARAREALLPLSKENTSMGAQARLSMVIDIAFSRQLAKEINRGTSVEFMSDALAAVCANMITSISISVLGSDTDRHALVGMCNEQMFKIARCLMLGLKGEAEKVYEASVDLERGGHA